MFGDEEHAICHRSVDPSVDRPTFGSERLSGRLNIDGLWRQESNLRAAARDRASWLSKGGSELYTFTIHYIFLLHTFIETTTTNLVLLRGLLQKSAQVAFLTLSSESVLKMFRRGFGQNLCG